MAGEWPLRSLRDVGVALIDCEHRTPAASNSGLPYIAIPQIKAGRLDLTDVRRIGEADFVEWTRKAKPVSLEKIATATPSSSKSTRQLPTSSQLQS